MPENVKRKFEVHKLEGTTVRSIATPKADKKRKDKEGNPILLGGFDYEDKEVDAGWMVYFPSGSSIRILTREEMERQGFLAPADFVDMDSGETVAAPSETSLKEISERKTTRTRSSLAAQT
jgi:hypothetical protein